MNIGRSLQVRVGTVAFFKQKTLMKSFINKLFFIVTIWLLVASCSSRKNIKTVIISKSNLSETKTPFENPFFKESADQIKWVDSVYSQMTADERIR